MPSAGRQRRIFQSKTEWIDSGKAAASERVGRPTCFRSAKTGSINVAAHTLQALKGVLSHVYCANLPKANRQVAPVTRSDVLQNNYKYLHFGTIIDFDLLKRHNIIRNLTERTDYMKTLILIVALCVACLLTGCKNMQKDDSPAVTDPTDGAGIVTEDVMPEEPPEDDNEPAVTEPTVRVPQPGDIETYDITGFEGYPALVQDKLAFFHYGYEASSFLRITDLSFNELAVINFAEGSNINNIRSGEGDVLCTFALSTYTADEVIYTDKTVYTDFTVSESADRDLYITVGDHSVEEDWINLVDAKTGELLVEGHEGENEYGIDRQFKRFGMTIDENRFLYITGGYEAIPGFGIYDFSTGKATDVPDSRDMIPLGIYDGYIYSEHSAWDGFGTEIYKTNIDTLETELAFGIPFEADNDGYVWYQMSPSGEYILIINDYYIRGEDGSFINGIVDMYKVSVADGSIAWQFTLPLDAGLQSPGIFLNENTYLLSAFERGESGSYSVQSLLQITLG